MTNYSAVRGLISGPLSPPIPPLSSTAGRSRRVGGCSVFFAVTVFLVPLDPLARQADLALVSIDPQDLDLDRLADLDDLFRVFDLVVSQLRDVQQAFESVLQADEHAKVGELRHGAGHDLARLILVGNVRGPGVLGHLLEPQRDAAAFLVDRQHLALDLLPLLDSLAGVADLARPGHVADVQQAVDAFFDFDEGTVIGQVADGAGDQGAGRIALGNLVPRIGLGLLHAQRDFLLLLVDPSTTTSISSSICTSSLG